MIKLTNVISRACFYFTVAIIVTGILGSFESIGVVTGVMLTLFGFITPALMVLVPIFFVLGLVFLKRDGSEGMKNLYYLGLPLLIMVMVFVFPNSPIYKFKPIHNVAVTFSIGNSLTRLYGGSIIDQTLTTDQKIDFISPVSGDALTYGQETAIRWKGSDSLLKYLASVPTGYDIHVAFFLEGAGTYGGKAIYVNKNASNDFLGEWPLWNDFAINTEKTATWDPPATYYPGSPVWLEAKLIIEEQGCISGNGVPCNYLDLPITRKVLGRSENFTLK